MIALLIPADNRKPFELLTLKKGDGGLLDMQKAVGGFVEAVTLPGADLYVNKDGRALQLPANSRATILIAQTFQTSEVCTIVGDALLTGYNGADVPEAVLRTMEQLAEQKSDGV